MTRCAPLRDLATDPATDVPALMGAAAYARLAPAVRRLHALQGDVVLRGQVRVAAPSGRAACLLAWCLGTPRAAQDGPIVFELQEDDGRQAMRLLADAGLRVEGLQTLLLVERGRSWQHTGAIIRLLDRLVARNRYRWFGKSEVCMVPQPRYQDRFLP